MNRLKKYISTVLAVLSILSLIAGCAEQGLTPTASPVISLTPGMTLTPTLTPSLTQTPTPTQTPKPGYVPHTPTEIPEYPEGTPLYVSPNGSDENNGSAGSPFGSPQRAIDEVRRLVAEGLTQPVTVYFHAGEYKVTNLSFTEEDSGTAEYPVIYKAYGDGEVVFNAGTMLTNDMFKAVEDESVLGRLDDSIEAKIKVIDLAAAGLTLDDIGPLYAWGTSSTANKYDDGTVGNNSEIFWNDERMHLARWPNKADDYERFEGIVSQGDASKLIPGTMQLGEAALARIQTWSDYKDAGMFAYFQFDWADMAAPIKELNKETGHITLEHYSLYGYKDNGEYYFYNVLEELDAEGEYYIDRTNMLLYVYPPEGTENADALVSTVEKRLVDGSASNIRFDSITFKGSKSDLIVLKGNNISIINCKAMNCYGSAITLQGDNNLVFGCEVAYVGKSGITVNGGDRATLTNGNSIIENCYIHHFEEVYRTYQPGINVRGCGNKAISNEVAYAPHMAVSYYGNEHEIAYNYIHDVVYESSDAGALYVGGDWTCYGVVIKYNLFRNIGDAEKGKHANAIYFDDGMSAGEIFGNIIEDCAGFAFLLGGGRDIKVKNNLVISDNAPLYYDERLSILGWESSLNTNWTQEGVDNNWGMWSTLTRVPYLSDLWAERYPRLASISKDITDKYNPDLPLNPAYSEIMFNVFVGKKSAEEYWDVCNLADMLSEIKNNYSMQDEKTAFVDDTYKLNHIILGWKQIPYTEIGRYDNQITGRE